MSGKRSARRRLRVQAQASCQACDECQRCMCWAMSAARHNACGMRRRGRGVCQCGFFGRADSFERFDKFMRNTHDTNEPLRL